MRHRHAIMLFSIALPICVLLRTIQMCFTIDSTTGFIKQQYSAIGVIISVIICATTAAVGLLAATIENTKQNKAAQRPAVAIAAALAGGMFFYQTVAQTQSGLLLSFNGAWYDVLLIFLALVSAFVFVAYGLKNIYEYQMPNILLVAPVVYYIVRLISIFVSTSALARVTENVFLIFTNSVLLWFMFEFASFENEIGDTDKKPKRLFASGLAAVILCAVTSLSKIIFAMVSRVKLSNGDIASALLNAAIGVFILVYIICNFGEENGREKPSSKHSA